MQICFFATEGLEKSNYGLRGLKDKKRTTNRHQLKQKIFHHKLMKKMKEGLKKKLRYLPRQGTARRADFSDFAQIIDLEFGIVDLGF